MADTGYLAPDACRKAVKQSGDGLISHSSTSQGMQPNVSVDMQSIILKHFNNDDLNSLLTT